MWRREFTAALFVTTWGLPAPAAINESDAAAGVNDALQIVRGGPTEVTDFFAARTRQPLGEKFLPVR